jgi:hypothetical protein
MVTPATVAGWHRQGFRLYWRWQLRGCPGHPRIDPELRRLIRRTSRENTLCGAPRIQAELRLLGHDAAESGVARYMARSTPELSALTVGERKAGTSLRKPARTANSVGTGRLPPA